MQRSEIAPIENRELLAQNPLYFAGAIWFNSRILYGQTSPRNFLRPETKAFMSVKYRRILLKLSGEVLLNRETSQCIDPEVVARVTARWHEFGLPLT